MEERGWISAGEFEDSIAACNLLPGPASTQLAILTAHRVRGVAGAIVGGLAFILPGFVTIIALAVLFLATSPPDIVRALGAGAGSAVAAVALGAGVSLAHPSWDKSTARWRWALYVSLGAVVATATGPYVVIVLLVCGFAETMIGRRRGVSPGFIVLGASGVAAGGVVALAWLAFKVGALSYGGGFVIVPLMQFEAVSLHNWMTDSQFLNAVVLGQVTPGPVVLTVAVVGYAAFGLGGATLATFIAFGPSFLFVIGGARHFDALRANRNVRAFLDGAGPAAIGAIFGATVPLAMALDHAWQYTVLAVAVIWTVMMRKGVVSTLFCASLVGAVVFLVGGPIA